jgi:hypothetical protein
MCNPIQNVTIPFVITPLKVKDLYVNLTKYVQNLYTENCKMLIKETREDLSKWADST